MALDTTRGSKSEFGLQKWVLTTSPSCTNCGELIASIDAGWVEWLSSEGDRGVEVWNGLQLVHRGSVLPNGQGQTCRYDCLKEFKNSKTIVEGLPLERFVGPDGLMMLFSFLADGNLPQEEILELAKRVQIPGYELTRSLLRERLGPRSRLETKTIQGQFIKRGLNATVADLSEPKAGWLPDNCSRQGQ